MEMGNLQNHSMLVIQNHSQQFKK